MRHPYAPLNAAGEKLIFLMRFGYVDPNDRICVVIRGVYPIPVVLTLQARRLVDPPWKQGVFAFESTMRYFGREACTGMPMIEMQFKAVARAPEDEKGTPQ